MKVEEYIQSLPDNEKHIISNFRQVILDTDKKVTEKVGPMMSIENAICFEEEGVFKYGLTITKNHISFHSLVMYANPVLMDALKEELTKVKFMKGCINLKKQDDFPVAVFKKHMKASAKTDFSPMIQHYKSKKK